MAVQVPRWLCCQLVVSYSLFPFLVLRIARYAFWCDTMRYDLNMAHILGYALGIFCTRPQVSSTVKTGTTEIHIYGVLYCADVWSSSIKALFVWNDSVLPSITSSKLVFFITGTAVKESSLSFELLIWGMNFFSIASQRLKVDWQLKLVNTTKLFSDISSRSFL